MRIAFFPFEHAARPGFHRFSWGGVLKDAPEFAVTSFCALFRCPTGDFRLARRPYRMIFAFGVPFTWPENRPSPG